jgi:hypothetical protein
VLVNPANSLASDIICPADVFAQKYDDFLSKSDARLGFRVEPIIYGSASEVSSLAEKFREMPGPEKSGVTYYFTSKKMDDLYRHSCEDCGTVDYYKALMSCSYELGSTCFEFSISIDGNTQCMLIPKPEI